MKRLACLLLAMSATAIADDRVATELDPATGLVVAPGWLHVRAHCGGCHSHALVTAQRGDRATWLRIIRWMQETQNFWTLEPAVEAEMLDYLADAYKPAPPRRRAPLPDALLPNGDS